jgi:hypothetical protein
MSERNEENDEANGQAIRARADLRYLARTSPPIPENAGGAQANRGDKGNSRQRISLGGHYRAEANLALECMVTLGLNPACYAPADPISKWLWQLELQFRFGQRDKKAT